MASRPSFAPYFELSENFLQLPHRLVALLPIRAHDCHAFAQHERLGDFELGILVTAKLDFSRYRVGQLYQIDPAVLIDNAAHLLRRLSDF